MDQLREENHVKQARSLIADVSWAEVVTREYSLSGPAIWKGDGKEYVELTPDLKSYFKTQGKL